MKQLAKFTLKLIGWKIKMDVPFFDKAVYVVAPHTSNWDFILGKIAYDSTGDFANFMIKDSWTKGAIGLIIKKIGGIGVNRGRSIHFTDQIVNIFNKREKFIVAITPEGTRKKVMKWKRGFYQIAQKANVPIVLIKIDYKLKLIHFFEVFEPTGDEKADIATIMSKYKGVTACHPEKFYCGE